VSSIPVREYAICYFSPHVPHDRNDSQYTQIFLKAPPMNVYDGWGFHFTDGLELRWIDIIEAREVGGRLQFTVSVDRYTVSLVQMNANRSISLRDNVR
jgi:hypothetical protein